VVSAVVAAEALLFALLGQLDAPLRGGDAHTYLRLARNLAQHGVFSDSAGSHLDPNVWRSPGYPAFLAALQLIGVQSVAALRIAQLALLGLTAYLTGHIGRRVGGVRVGLVSAVGTATYLPLVWQAAEQMTECLAAVGFVALALVSLAALEREGHAALRAWALAGCILGLTAYVRPTTLYLSAGVALLILAQTRRVAAAACFVLAVFLVVAPWTVRTSLLVHHVVPLEVGAGSGEYASASQFAGRLEIPLQGTGWIDYKAASRRITHSLREGRFTPSEQLEADELMRRAVPPVTAAELAQRLPVRMAALWGPADETPTEQSWSASVHRLAVLQFWVLAALALCAAVALRRRILRLWPLWLPAVYLAAVHTVLHVESRYTVPVRPLLIVLAGIAVMRWRRPAAALSAG
jgi:hypothetical protein